MKIKIKIFLLGYLILMLYQTGYSQKDSKKNWVIGNWKLVRLEIPTYEAQLRTASEAQKSQILSSLKTMMKSAYFEFKQDGTYYIIFGGNSEKGTWQLNPSSSRLLIRKKLEDGSLEQTPTQIAIEELSKNKIILLNDYQSGEIIRMTLHK